MNRPNAHGLSFHALRRANIARLPTFRNATGELSHSKPDGSDWSPADWMTATVGEVGEAANLMKKLRRPDFGLDEFVNKLGSTPREALAKEFADIVTYLDILAMQYDIDLGDAVFEKFNEISERVGSPIRMRDGTNCDDDPGAAMPCDIVTGRDL